MHNARIILPSPLASILQQNPQLLAPAVEVFYHRDPEDIKAARAMENFPADSVSSNIHIIPSLKFSLIFSHHSDISLGIQFWASYQKNLKVHTNWGMIDFQSEYHQAAISSLRVEHSGLRKMFSYFFCCGFKQLQRKLQEVLLCYAYISREVGFVLLQFGLKRWKLRDFSQKNLIIFFIQFGKKRFCKGQCLVIGAKEPFNITAPMKCLLNVFFSGFSICKWVPEKSYMLQFSS